MTAPIDALFADALKNKTAPANAAATTPVVDPALNPETETNEDETPAPVVDELAILKQRATLMGIKFSNNIKLETLKAKVIAQIEGESNQDDETDNEDETPENDTPEAQPQINEVVQAAPVTTAPKLTPNQVKKRNRATMVAEQMRLVRCRITNLNPAKKDLPGEIFTFANGVLGAVRKFVPYGEATDNGYHIPFCIYTQLKEREFLNIKTRKDSRGRTIVETSMAREFAIEELPQLTQKELAALAAQQAASKGLD